MKKKNKATWRDGGLVVKGNKVLAVDGRERKRRGRKSVEGREGGEEGEERVAVAVAERRFSGSGL
jgi:hypothetical protein